MASTKGKKKIETKKIMIGCPEDVEKKFLNIIKDAIKEFNEQQENQVGVHLEVRHWRSGAHSDAQNPQVSINKQLCDECDYLLAVFYCSAGSAIASEDAGTFMEINYFCKNEKQVFLHRFAGEMSVDLSKPDEWKKLQEYLNRLDKELKNLTFKDYTDENSLKQGIIDDLTIFFRKKTKKTRGNLSKRLRRTKGEVTNELQKCMRERMSSFDACFDIDGNKMRFSFSEKAKDLIAGIQEDGSVQYYVGKNERFRTTPTASTLEALYLAKLLPDTVCHTMQDWVYKSRQDPSDDPGKKGKSEGHKPDAKDMPGWSWNEGVSVWATSKALGTLIVTGYYERQEILLDSEIMQTTYNALEWLADQEYDNGGWGFQHAPEKEACKASVTMTALALKVITKFLMDSAENPNQICIDHDLEKKLSNAKRKGITYLLDTMKEDKDHAYWEYDNKPSLTGTIWVLDFINMTPKKEARKLNDKLEKIVAFCVSRLPSSVREFEDYREEVYFVGGETKYKLIEKYSKFYSYLPYHIPVIMQSEVELRSEDIKRIEICIRALIMGKKEYWNGRENSDGYFQHPTCFVRAMALSVVAFWMQKTVGKIAFDRLQ